MHSFGYPAFEDIDIDTRDEWQPTLLEIITGEGSQYYIRNNNIKHASGSHYRYGRHVNDMPVRPAKPSKAANIVGQNGVYFSRYAAAMKTMIEYYLLMTMILLV